MGALEHKPDEPWSAREREQTNKNKMSREMKEGGVEVFSGLFVSSLPTSKARYSYVAGLINIKTHPRTNEYLLSRFVSHNSKQFY